MKKKKRSVFSIIVLLLILSAIIFTLTSNQYTDQQKADFINEIIEINKQILIND